MDSNPEHKRSRETQPRDRNVFRFLDLPVEIRNMIYPLTLEYSNSISIRRTKSNHEAHPINISILRVCRQISQEAIPIFGLGNTFRFSPRQGCVPSSDNYPSRRPYLENLSTNKKYASLMRNIIIDVRGSWYWRLPACNILSEVRMVYAAKRDGITLKFSDSPHGEREDILGALVYTLAEYYHAFSNYERSMAGIWICDSLRSGYVRYYTPIKESAKADGTWEATDKHFSILEGGRKVVFSTPLRYISELPTNVLLRIADLANESEKPVEITLSYGKPQKILGDRSFSGNMQINPFVQERSPAYYFNNTRFRVTLNTGFVARDAWNKQFQPLTEWAKRYLPYHGLGTPVPFRHIAFIIDFGDRDHWLRSSSKHVVFNISILELIRIFVHLHQDSIDFVFKTPWSTVSLSLKDLRHLALVYLTQTFGLGYSEDHVATRECPRIQLDGYGALQDARPRSNDSSKFPGKRYYDSDKFEDLLHLFERLDRVGISGRQVGRKHSSMRYDKLRSANSCMSYLREVLSEPDRVKDIATVYYMPLKERPWPKSPWD